MIDEDRLRYLEQAVLLYIFVSDQVTEKQLKVELTLDDELYETLMDSYLARGFVAVERGVVRLTEAGEDFIAR